jgi:hypothetical protein
VNAKNHGRDPWDVLEQLPLERTRQIHLAGHSREGERLLDDHGSPVPDPVWALYAAVVARIGPVPTLIEWDTNVPPLERVLDEARHASAIAAESHGAGALELFH